MVRVTFLIIFMTVVFSGVVHAQAPLGDVEWYKKLISDVLTFYLDARSRNSQWLFMGWGQDIVFTREQIIGDIKSGLFTVSDSVIHFHPSYSSLKGWSLRRIIASFKIDHPTVPLLFEMPERFTRATFWLRLITPEDDFHPGLFARMCKKIGLQSKKRFKYWSRGASGAGIIILSLGIDAAVSKKVAADYPDWAKHKAPPSARKGIGNHAGAGP